MAKYRMIGVICLFCILVAFAAPQGTAGSSDSYERARTIARSEIWQAINSGKCGSAVVAVTVRGKLVYAEGFGMANREKSIPVRPATLFNIGSISKVYAAAAIMLLVDDGKVSLDRPVSDYLSEFKMTDERYRKITVRMLLNHTSGLPGTDGSNAFGFKYRDAKKPETIATLARSRLKHEPGAMAVYCNDGFTLAEMIVERTSGKKYIAFLNERIFKPLGLTDTGMGVAEMKGKPVALYYDAKTGKVHPPESLSILGAGGLSATAPDLCLFVDALLANKKLLRKASQDEMRKAQPSAFWGRLRNPEFSYGLGWDMTGLPRYDAAGLQILGKSGGTGNYSSMVYTVPDKRIAVAVIASGADSGAMTIALDVLDAVLLEKKLISDAEKAVGVPPRARPWPSEEASFAGYYADGGKVGQIIFDADKKSAALYVLKDREKIPALSFAYHRGYYHDAQGERFYFAGVGNEVYLVASPPRAGIDMVTMQKIKPVEKPGRLRIDMDGAVWMRRNVSPDEGLMAVSSHIEKSLLYGDLPGYVYFRGIKRIDSPEFAGMPFDAVRDQSELTLFEKDGATWAWISDLLYSPAADCRALQGGENLVRIGGDGYSEWRRAGDDAVLNFIRPRGGRIIVFSAEGTATYDSAVDAGGVYAARGAYVEFAGKAHDVFTVKARPAFAPENR